MEERRRLTRNRQSLTAHDEDDLHGAELLKAQGTARLDRKAKLRAKDCTEDANADDGHDVGSLLRPVETFAVLPAGGITHSQTGSLLTIHNHQVEAEPNSECRDNTAESEDGDAIHLCHGRGADDVHLRDQRQLDEHKDQRGDDAVGD